MSLLSRVADAARRALGGSSALVVKDAPAGTTTLPSGWGSSSNWWGVIRESFAGAWQNNVELAPTHTLLAFSAVYSCVSLISDDISKMRIKLMEPSGKIWQEVQQHPAFGAVLRKPNPYQTRVQFLSQWIQSKLVHGNTFVYLERDNRNVVVAMYVLNPRLVTVAVAQDGSVWYQLSSDKLAGLAAPIMVPATDLIHDRAVCLFHPLIGVSPLFACAMSASQGNRIQQNSSKFFQNASRPSGVLSIKRLIADKDMEAIKQRMDAGYTGDNVGKMLITDSDVTFTSLGMVTADNAQLIEQLKWTVTDVASAFHVPLYKLGADAGTKFNNMAAMNQDYYSQCLQVLIENVELLLDEGLGLAKAGFRSELDLSGLLRMDQTAQIDFIEKAIRAGAMKPNEGREILDLPPVEGGDQVYMQQQMFPLSVLVKQPVPGSAPPPAPPPAGAAPAPAAAAAAEDAAAGAAKRLEEMERFVREAATHLSDQSEVARMQVEKFISDSVKTATEQLAQFEAGAARRHEDHMAVLREAQVQVDKEREELAQRRAEMEESARIAQAAAELEGSEVTEDDLVASLIDAFEAASAVNDT